MDPSFMLTPKPSLLGLPGFRFLPTDQEILLVHFHQMVVAKQPLPPPLDRVIRRCDVFGNKSEPSAIWNHFGGDEFHDLNGSLYFLSKLTKNGSRIDRKIARGTWSETVPYRDVPRFDPNDSDCPGEIGSSNNPVIGKKRKFRYENPSEDITEDHTAWLLDEYSLIDKVGGGDADQKDSSENKYDFDYVICRLRRNGRTQTAGNETVQNSDKKRKRLPKETKIKPAKNQRVKKDQSKEKKMIKPSNKRVKKDESKATNEAGGSCSTSSTPFPVVSNAKDKEQPPPLVNVTTEEEEDIMETTPSKKMRSDSEDDGYHQLVVMESQSDQGVFSECLPDLSDIDVDTEINWDFDQALFEQCDFGKLDCDVDLQVLDQLLGCSAEEEPTLAWW